MVLMRKKEGITNDFKMLKFRFMKRELDERAFKKDWDAKNAEMTVIERQIAELDAKF